MRGDVVKRTGLDGEVRLCCTFHKNLAKRLPRAFLIQLNPGLV
jgi:hypothetical protein